MNLIKTLERMAHSAEFEYSHWATDELDSLKKEDREAIETVRAMLEALQACSDDVMGWQILMHDAIRKATGADNA